MANVAYQVRGRTLRLHTKVPHPRRKHKRRLAREVRAYLAFWAVART